MTEVIHGAPPLSALREFRCQECGGAFLKLRVMSPKVLCQYCRQAMHNEAAHAKKKAKREAQS